MLILFVSLQSLWFLVEGLRTCLLVVCRGKYNNPQNAELRPLAADDHTNQPQDLSTYNFNPDYN